MKCDVTTVVEYITALPDERRAVIEKLRNVVLTHLPTGCSERVTARWERHGALLPVF